MDARSLEGSKRSAQLTYTAFDASESLSSAGSGGWRVKQLSSDLHEDERDHLLALVTPVLRLVTPLSRFPTPAEIASLPRRLTFRALDDGRGAFCHAVHAGTDVSGRPDNVFSHALIHRSLTEDAAGPEPVRPIQLWRASQWLAPFGATAVQTAEFSDDDPPCPSTEITRKRVISFLFDESAYRFGSMAFLLDATAAALAGGPPVALATDSPDEGALWLGVVSFVAAPPTCLQLSFSTYERLDSLFHGGAAPLLSTVPKADVAKGPEITPDTVVVVDVTDDAGLDVDEERGVWRNRWGQQVPVSAWSRLAVDACGQGPEEFERILLSADSASRETGWRPDDNPAWPLAVAVAKEASLELSWPTACRVVLQHTPDTAELSADLVALLSGLVTKCTGGSKEETWNLLRDSRGADGYNHDLYEVVFRTYLELALSEAVRSSPWPPIPLPAVAFQPSSEILRALERLFREATDGVTSSSSPGDQIERAVRQIRLLDLLVRTEAIVGRLSQQLKTHELLADSAAAYLCGGYAARVVGHTDDLDARTVRDFICPAVRFMIAADRSVPGTRLDPAVTQVLSRGFDLPLLALSAGEGTTSDPLATEVLVHLFRSGGAHARQLRSAAAAALLQPGVEWPVNMSTNRCVMQALRQVEGAEPWTVEELIDVAKAIGPGVDVGFAHAACDLLRDAEPSAEARELATRALEAHGTARGDAAASAGLSPAQSAMLRFLATAEPHWHLKAGRQADALHLLQEAACFWPAGDDALRRRFAPDVLLAIVLTAVAVTRRRLSSQDLDSLENLPIETLAMDAASLGLPAALPLTDELIHQERFRDVLLRVSAYEVVNPSSSPLSLTRLPLPPELAATFGTPDLIRALLRHALAGKNRKEVLAIGRYVAETFNSGYKSQQRLVRWWEPVVPSPTGLGSRTGAVRDALSRNRNVR